MLFLQTSDSIILQTRKLSGISLIARNDFGTTWAREHNQQMMRKETFTQIVNIWELSLESDC